VITGSDRWGMLDSCVRAGYDITIGDLMFTLGIPLALHTPRSVKILAAVLMPIASRLPFEWIYPIGKDQEKRTPKWTKYFDAANIVLGDCHYITKYMPERMDGKVIVTNTTTTSDVELFRKAGVKYLLTTTPVLDGRSFGTNMMEAALAAAAGRTTPVDYAHSGSYLDDLAKLLKQLKFEPQLQEL
jgi:hypothetical protein